VKSSSAYFAVKALALYAAASMNKNSFPKKALTGASLY
jgi:hypothetical protein